MTRAGTVAALALLATTAPAAAAAERPAEPLPQQAVSANLRVHYTTAPDNPHRITDEHAHSVLVHGEAALATVVAGWGYEILRDGTLGGDERIDIYIAEILPTGKGGRTQPDQPASRTSGFVTMTPRASAARTIAHELFHLAQYALDRTESTWLKEATAEWAEHRITGDYANGLPAYRPEFALDCDDDACGGGYQSWRFFEYLTERHGIAIVKRTFEHARDLGPGGQALNAIDRALRERGSGLAATFADFSWANMTGDYGRPEVAAWRAGPHATLLAPSSGRSASVTVGVERLATRYVAVAAPAMAPCRAAAFTLRVTPAASSAYLRHGMVVPLADGRGTVAWDTCGGLSLLVAVPNTNGAAGVTSHRVEASAPAPPVTSPPPPPPVKPAPALTTTVRVIRGQRMSSVLRRGLRLRVSGNRAVAARISVTVRAGRQTRRRLALRRSVTRTVSPTVKRLVALRVREAHQRAPMPRRLRLFVVARLTGPRGETRLHRLTVTLTPRSARSTR